MRQALSTWAILLVLCCSNTCSAQMVDSNKIITSLTRCWRAFSHEYATIYGLDEEEIKRYSKQKVCFTRDSVSLYYSTTYAPKYTIKKVKADDYARTNFDFEKQKMGIIADSVFEVTISSLSKPSKGGAVHKMTDIIAFDGACTYIVVDGVIFKLIDADSKVQPRSSY
jgi:hypothetical protein